MPRANSRPSRRRRAPKKTSLGGTRPNLPQLDPHSLPGPESVVRQRLPNGITVLVRENFLSPSVVIQGTCWAGGLDEAEEKAGLASLTAASLMRGTERRTFHQIYDALESVGASLAFGSGMHTTSFYARSLAEDCAAVAELAAAALQVPSFPADQVERLRGEYLTDLAIRQEDTGARAQLAFNSLAYAGHPYAHDDEGTIETVRAITREELVKFHQEYYGPRGMIIAVAGAVHSARALSLIEKHFGSWTNPGQPARPSLPPAPRLERLVQTRVTLPGKSQADLVIGAPGPSRSSPDYIPAMLGNNILGRFGMFGRIGEAVRESEGLAYYSFSTLSGGLGPGPWMVVAGISPRNLQRAIELIRREVERFVQTRVTQSELIDNQASLIGRLPLQLESNDGVAAALMNLELFGLGLEYYLRYPQIIRSVKREEIWESARRYLHPDRLAIGMAGPADES
jgi:zinc protease